MFEMPWPITEPAMEPAMLEAIIPIMPGPWGATAAGAAAPAV